MVRRTKAPATLLLEQFKRQAYYSLYLNGRTLVEFTALMDKLFKKIREYTQVELQVGYVAQVGTICIDVLIVTGG